MRQEILWSVAKSYWEQALCTEVGPNDNFFELGGTSLLATQVVFRLAAQIGLDPGPIYYALYDTQCLDEFSAELALRIAEVPDARPLTGSITAANQAGPVRLSFAQERLWFLEQMNPGAAVYHIPFAIQIRTSLDQAALQSALEALVVRQGALRTRMEIGAGGVAYQVLDPPRPVALMVHDLRGLEPVRRAAAVEHLLASEVAQPFDLIRSPLFRVGLFRLGPQDHLLYLTMHHLISDAWSVWVIVRDLAELYRARLEGRTPDLPDLPIQYSDYVLWQRERLQPERLEQLLSYWTEELAGASAVLELPTDRPRPSLPSFHGERLAFSVDRTLTSQLRAVSGEQKATLFMVILAAFNILLSRYCAQEDILVGLPIANRGALETDGLIGFFINTLVIRTDLSGAPSFRALLGQVRRRALGAYAHQELPLERLVEELQPVRDLSRQPLFQVMLNMTDQDALPVKVPDHWDLQFGHQRTSKFDLTLYFSQRPESLPFEIEYAVDLFERPTIERFIGHFKRVLEGVVRDPDQPITHLSLLTDREQAQLISEWSGTNAEYPADSLIHDLFAQQAASTPDAIAVEQNGRFLTYAALDRRSNQLARHLWALGVRPEAPVGLYLERSIEWAVSLLAILKAGGCYVPLDLSYPKDRLKYLFQQTSPRLVLTKASLRSQLDEIAAVEMIELDTESAAISARIGTPPPRSGVPENLAYILFTSGSTGRPKGVMIRHSGFVSYLRQMSGIFSLDPDDAVLQVTSASFDPSLREFFAPLSSGRRLVLLDGGEVSDPMACLRLIQEGSVSKILGVTPSMLKMILACAAESDCSRCRLNAIFPSGEILEQSLCLEVWKTFGPQVGITNIYGPTETTLTCCAFPVIPRDGGRAPIGQPIANSRAYVLDSYGELLPIGMPGELYIGGIGLGRGYIRQPDLTAERFVPDPFDAGQRLYRTGDRVRWSADAVLEFLGRVDYQVKVRGYRIELGEIESVLSEYPDVSEAAVRTWESGPEEKRLVGYLVWREGAVADTGKVRSFLKQRLPEYMIPSALVELERLPLMPNRKLDRTALPPPLGRSEEHLYVLPRSPMEVLLHWIWTDILETERLGIHDDFFELGGHSLLATRMIAQVRNLLKIELPLRDVFERPTIAELVERLEEMQRNDVGLALPPLTPGPRVGPAPMSYAQERLWFLEQLGTVGAAYHAPAAFCLRGVLEIRALERSLAELVRRHESLRTRFETIDGEGRQVINPAGEFDLEVIDLSPLPEEERAVEARRLRRAEIEQPFDLTRGSLFRARLLRLGDEDHLLLMTLHHIISDGWSVGVLVSELGTLYAGLMEGWMPQLPELPVQYVDYARWQREWLSGEVLERQLGYWRERLEGAPVLELPTDRPRPAVSDFKGAAVKFDLSPETVAELERVGRAAGATLYMVLLTGVQALLGRWSGQQDLVVGSPIAGRISRETEGLIGFFVNMLALRVDLSGEPGFLELLGRVKEITLGAYAHQDMPFEKLVAELQPIRDLSRSPLVQVTLVLQNLPRAELALPGLKVRPVEREHETSKFDLAIGLQETSLGLGGVAEYATALFDAATIERFIGHWRRLLEGVAANPESNIWEVPILGEEERRQLLEECAATVEGPTLRMIHELFEEQVRQGPDRVAVVYKEQALSYHELNLRANRLAHYLWQLGVRPEVLVGIFLERGLELIESLLGILKAGGAYLPLDTDYPSDRIAFMLADARPRAVLTRERWLEELPAFDGETVCLDRDQTLIAKQREENLQSAGSLENLAYVIYTSGSTGQPKGAAVYHRGEANLLNWFIRDFEISADDKVLLITSANFDLTQKNFFAPLIAGATVCLSRHQHYDPVGIRQEIGERAATLLNCTPSAFYPVVDQLEEPGLNALKTLRLVFLGGEPIAMRQLGDWLRSEHCHAQVVNTYGPTECTDICASYQIAEPERFQEARVPIGRPIHNTQLFILGPKLELLPVGAVGELCIQGDGVGAGYLNNAGLTAERFVASPFSKDPKLLYRTGDLARYLSNGCLELLGRIDHQVKIRGYRIELGEIEAALRNHPQVSEAVVVVREKIEGDKRLVAYLVGREGAAPEYTELRNFLKERLPDYMAPVAIKVLDHLPLTPNGKLDRNALPAPEEWAAAEYVAARTPLEELLTEIWAEVLQVERVGVHDNFFDLGGHSLIATSMISRVRSECGVEVSLRSVFEAPTPAALEKRIQTMRCISGQSSELSTVGQDDEEYEEGVI